MLNKNAISFNKMENRKKYKWTLLIKSMTESSTSTGNPFVKMKLSDREASIEARIFNNTTIEELLREGITIGSIVDVEIYVNEGYYNLNNVSLCFDPTITINDFIPSISNEPNALFSDLMILIRKDIDVVEKGNYDLMKVTEELLVNNKDKFISYPAGTSEHHALAGGLLLHTYRMVKMACDVSRDYPELDRALLLCGTALHDIGKLEELSFDGVNVSYTEKGKLYGHSVLGKLMLDEVAERNRCNTEKVILLGHIILSHHGACSMGAAINPILPEAKCIHWIDQMDVMIYKDSKKKGYINGIDNVLSLKESDPIEESNVVEKDDVNVDCSNELVDDETSAENERESSINEDPFSEDSEIGNAPWDDVESDFESYNEGEEEYYGYY